MTFDEVCGQLNVVHAIADHDDYTVVSANGGCAFVVDRNNPHLGGNLEGGDPGTRYDMSVWPWLIENFKPKSVLDVGCAEGYVVSWFSQHQVEAHGIDGLPYNIAFGQRNGIKNLAVHDLTTGPYLERQVDVIWCCDVVEHIAEAYLGNVMKTFQQARVVLLTNGTDRHAGEGWHHITNLPDTFWVQWMKDGGFELDEALTAESRALCQEGWYKHLGKVFVAK